MPRIAQNRDDIKVTDLPCLRDSQSSLQYLRSLVTDYCTRKWSQRKWTHPMPRVPHLTNARHHLLPSHLRGNSPITPPATISSVRYSVTIGTAGATSAWKPKSPQTNVPTSERSSNALCPAAIPMPVMPAISAPVASTSAMFLSLARPAFAPPAARCASTTGLTTSSAISSIINENSASFPASVSKRLLLHSTSRAKMTCLEPLTHLPAGATPSDSLLAAVGNPATHPGC